MNNFTRRRFLQSSSAAILTTGAFPLVSSGPAKAKFGDTLTIAYTSAPPSWDACTGIHSVAPGTQAIFRTIYDPYVVHNPDLSLAPGIMEKFGWNEDRTKISLTLRQRVKWHDGEPVTVDDVIWNLKRLGDPKAGHPLQPVFASNKNFKADGNTITFDVDPYRANMMERLTFLGAYLLPQKYYEKVGAEGFEKQPIGSGPYIFDRYERGSFLRLRAFDDYWGGKAEFPTVIYKFVADASSRVAEIERGTSHVTLDIPYEEYDRLIKLPGLAGACHPISDVGLIFLHNIGPFADFNVRRAAALAIDKKAIIERLHRGYGRPLGTLLVPEYKGFDPNIQTPYDPKQAATLLAKSGFSPAKPVEIVFQTPRGFKPKDYETVQAITQMWRRVGINATIEVQEIAKHFELRAKHQLAPAAFYNWGNASGDPESSMGLSVNSKSPFSSWRGGEVDPMLPPLFSEKDEKKRLDGYRALSRVIEQNTYILPVLQYYQPVVYSKELKFTSHTAGYVMPSLFKRA